MVVVCVNNSDLILGPNQTLLTIGKSYELIEQSSDSKSTMYLIIDDEGQKAQYDGKRFIPLSQIRAEKLQELGI